MIRQSIVAALAALAVVTAAAQAAYVPGPTAGRAAPGAFVQPSSVAVSPDGTKVAVVDARLLRLTVLDGVSGAVVYVVGPFDGDPQTLRSGTPGDVAITDDGTVFIAMPFELLRLGPTGLVEKRTSVGWVDGLAVSADGATVVVGNGLGAATVDVMDRNFENKRRLVNKGDAPPGLQSATSIAVAGGLAAVLDGTRKRVELYQLADGAHVGQLGAGPGSDATLVAPTKIAAAGDVLSVLDGAAIRRFDAAARTALPRLEAGVLGSDVAAAQDEVLVAVRAQNGGPVRRLHVAGGSPPATLGRYATAPGELFGPQGLVALPDGSAVVVDSQIGFRAALKRIVPATGAGAVFGDPELLSATRSAARAPDGSVVLFGDGQARWHAPDGAAGAVVALPDETDHELIVPLADGGYGAVDGVTGQVRRLAADGTPTGMQFGTTPDGEYPSGLAATPDGGVVVAREPGFTRYRADGTVAATAAPLDPTDTLSFLYDLEVDARGAIYAIDGDDDVRKFRADGTEIGVVAGSASALGVSPAGDVIVVDQPRVRLATTIAEPPGTSISGGPGGPVAERRAVFSFTGAGTGGTYECSLDGAAYAVCPTPFTTPELADGPHELRVRAVDAVDLADPSPEVRAWVVDTTAPAVTIEAIEVSGASAVARFGSEAGAVLDCALDGAAFAPCTSPARLDGLTVGEHLLRVRATDQAGNTATAQRAFVVAAPGPGPGGGGGSAGGATGGGGTGGGTGGSGTTPPALVPRLAIRATARLDRRGRVPVRLSCAVTRCTGTFVLRDGRRIVARGRYSLAAGTRRTIAVRLTRAARAKVRRSRRVRLVFVSGLQRTSLVVRR